MGSGVFEGLALYVRVGAPMSIRASLRPWFGRSLGRSTAAGAAILCPDAGGRILF